MVIARKIAGSALKRGRKAAGKVASRSKAGVSLKKLNSKRKTLMRTHNTFQKLRKSVEGKNGQLFDLQDILRFNGTIRIFESKLKNIVMFKDRMQGKTISGVVNSFAKEKIKFLKSAGMKFTKGKKRNGSKKYIPPEILEEWKNLRDIRFKRKDMIKSIHSRETHGTYFQKLSPELVARRKKMTNQIQKDMAADAPRENELWQIIREIKYGPKK